ncbi:MAG: tetratricopeptide repeat protein [Nitrospiraceae bacterium]|nr:tetratricopeptide repeat protein [Nitrospiraceae bacterium]
MSKENTDPIIPLIPADLNRLSSQVVTWLHGFFSFSEGKSWTVSEYVGDLPPISLSKRQRQRALESLARGEAFLDRIGNQVLIPIRSITPDHPVIIGSLVLYRMDYSIGPDEANRWLPILQSWIEDRFRILRLESSIARPGQIPRYVFFALEDLCRNKSSSVSLIHLIQRPSINSSSPDHMTDFCSIVWNHSVPEWLGGNIGDSWFILHKTDEQELSSGIKRLVPLARINRLRISRAYGHRISGPFDPCRIERDIQDLETLARQMGTAVFCTSHLKTLEGHLGIDSLRLRLDQVKKTIKINPRYAIAYLRPIPDGLKDGLGQNTISISAGTDTAFLLKKLDRKVSESELTQWGEKLQEICTPPSTIGIAGAHQASVMPSKVAVAALWAFRHASLLGRGSIAVHDSLTWNVKGDEILSWGDLKGACREYRSGLKMDPSNANLLNSLGVCLAEMGRTKEAIKAFSRAAEAAPQDFMIHYNLAGAYLQRGDLKNAEHSLKRAYDLNPKDVRIAGRIAEVLIESGQARDALKVLDPFIKKTDTLPGPILRTLGKTYRATNRWNEARMAWQQAIKNNPRDAESMALLALGYLEETDDRETGIRLGEQAKRLGEESRQVCSILRRINKKLNSFQK